MFRLVLIWLLAGAVPLHGIAASPLAVCHVGCSERAEVLALCHELAMRNVDVAMSTTHQPMAADGSDARPSGEQSRHDRHFSMKCGACGVCCLSTAVVNVLSVFRPTLAAESFASFLPASVPASWTASLERPPRFSFA